MCRTPLASDEARRRQGREPRCQLGIAQPRVLLDDGPRGGGEIGVALQCLRDGGGDPRRRLVEGLAVLAGGGVLRLPRRPAAPASPTIRKSASRARATPRRGRALRDTRLDGLLVGLLDGLLDVLLHGLVDSLFHGSLGVSVASGTLVARRIPMLKTIGTGPCPH